MKFACFRQVALRWGAICALSVSVQLVNAQKLVRYSSEVRFQLDLHVPDQALRAYLPAGWAPNVAARGPAKDANLRVIFVDALSINDPNGAPLGSNRYVYLVAPVKDPGGASVQLVLGGLTDDSKDPTGPFGNFVPATVHKMERSISTKNGSLIESQQWLFAAPSGERIEMQIRFDRGAGFRTKRSETKYYSAKAPASYLISQQELILGILRNVTTHPADHVQKFSFKVSGGSYAKLFAGPMEVLSWDNILSMDRAILQP